MDDSFLDYLMPPQKRLQDRDQYLTRTRQALLRGEDAPPDRSLMGTLSSLSMPNLPQGFQTSGLPRYAGNDKPPQADVPIPDVGDYGGSGGATGSWGPTPTAANDFGTAPASPSKAPGRAQGLVKTMSSMGIASPGQRGPVGVPAAQPLPDALLQKQDELERQLREASGPADRTAMEEAYRKRAAQGGIEDALAMMAGEAKMQPFQAQHLKQAAAARAPMQMAGGVMTPQGFIEDPGYAQEHKVKQIMSQIAQNDRIIQANATAAEKRAAEARNEQLRRDMQQSQLAMQASIAQQGHLDRMAALDAKGAKAGKGAAIPSQADTEDTLKQIEGLLPHSTGSYAGAAVDLGARAFGHATTGAKAISAIAPLANRILMAVPRFEGPQSDKDTATYKEAAGNLADPTLPVEQRMAAIQTIRYINQKYRGQTAGGGNVVNYSDL